MTAEMDTEHFNNKRQPTETVAEIAPNRTLIAGLFTAHAPLKPIAVYGLQNLEMVFAHYQPEITLTLEAATGGNAPETLRFRRLEDFEPEQIGSQSDVLKQGKFLAAEYLKIARLLRVDTSLRQSLTSREKRLEVHAGIKKMMALLEQHL
ncbi:hypothetical protein [Niabella sp.]|uniref:hypothetical protein n=1 Tax=Niabella sp. TaxID=1962976 RepID=UPI00261A84B6|nr:hypothetical protein [Niabella sp.]